jgi:hypothetical protein
MRMLLGVITTLLFLTTGISFLSVGSQTIGVLLLLAAAYRGYILAKQIRWLLNANDDS